VSPTMRDLITCHFFAGIFASPNINNASATISDYIPRMYRGVSLGIYYSIPSLAATLGPLAGGFIIQSRDWRWTQWVAVIMAAATYLPVLLTRESYKGVILKRRARRLGLADSSPQTVPLGRKVQYFFVKLISDHYICCLLSLSLHWSAVTTV
jgi:MFS family permease